MPTGWFGIPGFTSSSTKVHFVEHGRPICGTRLRDGMQFQVCAHGFDDRIVECAACERINAKRAAGAANPTT